MLTPSTNGTGTCHHVRRHFVVPVRIAESAEQITLNISTFLISAGKTLGHQWEYHRID